MLPARTAGTVRVYADVLVGWGNQIRSYVMQPYTMVKDHRTNAESGNVGAVMDGELDLFINAYLKWVSLSK